VRDGREAFRGVVRTMGPDVGCCTNR
jgi:hypothetical protein